MTLKRLILEGIKESMAIDFLHRSIKDTEFENHVFIAGGFVRDEILGLNPKDIDLVIDIPNGGIVFSEWMTSKYKLHSPVIFPTFGTAKFNLDGIVHNNIDLSNIDIECVMTRGERYTPGSRKPEVKYADLKTDVERRDATINSLLKNISTGEILDLTGRGMTDIRSGIMRTPLDPNITFSDDPLRMLRFVRQATKYDWEISEESLEGIKSDANKLSSISKERIRDEINKMLEIANPRKAFELLKDLGLLPYVAKEFQQAVGMEQNAHHVDNVFDHSMAVLQQTRPDLVTRLIALFHDIGKVVTKTVTPKGVHFIGHESEGGKLVDKIMRDLKYPVDIIKQVRAGVEEHMKLKHGGDDAVKISDETLRKMFIKMGDNLEKLLDVINADNIAHAGPSAMPNQIENVRKRLAALAIKVKAPELPFNGDQLQSIFGVPQGEAVGIILDILTNLWYKQGHVSKKDAEHVVKSVMPQLSKMIQQRKEKRQRKLEYEARHPV